MICIKTELEPTWEKSWEDLMILAQGGDSAAYRRLLEEVQGPLTRFFIGRSMSAEVAEDLLQTTLLKLHVYRHSYDGCGKFSSWLFGIARNVARDHWSAGFSEGVGKTEDLAQEAKDAEKDEGTVTASAESEAEAQMTVEAAAASLSGDQLEIIHLVKVMGLSLDEAAQALGISLSATKVRAHRAYHAFKDAMARMVALVTLIG